MVRELDALVGSYVHLDKLPRASSALRDLQKIASLVKPIMRKRSWHVGSLTEFWPDQSNLLGLNVNRGQKICLRLRYAGDKNQFMPLEHVVDTMLHELCHNAVGPHNAEFHALWNQLRDEYDELKYKGYTGEGFMSEGHRLGGRNMPMSEVQRRNRMAAEGRKPQPGSGQRLGGRAVPRTTDIRSVIADAAQRRQSITQGCGSGTRDSEWLANEATYKGFRTQAEEAQANDRAIAEALWELSQEEDGAVPDQSLMGNAHFQSEGLTWSPESGLDMPPPRNRSKGPSAHPGPAESTWFSDRDSYSETKQTLPATTYNPTTKKQRQPPSATAAVSRLRPISHAGQPRPDSDVLGSPSNPKPKDLPPVPQVPKPTTGYPPEKVGLPRQKSLPRPPPPISTHPAFRGPEKDVTQSSAVSHKSNHSVSSMADSDPRTATSLSTSAFLSPTVYVRPEPRTPKPNATFKDSEDANTNGRMSAIPSKRTHSDLARLSTSSSSSSTSTRAPVPTTEATTSMSAPIPTVSLPTRPRDSMWTCPICTLCNPSTYLTCDACTTPRPCQGTIDDFSTISDLGPDAYPMASPLSPTELPTVTTPRHDSAYFNIPNESDDFWKPALPAEIGGGRETESSESASDSTRSSTPTTGRSSTIATASAVTMQRRSATAPTSATSPTAPRGSRPASMYSTGALRTAASLANATKDEIPAQLRPLGWTCVCGAFTERNFWACSACGKIKESS